MDFVFVSMVTIFSHVWLWVNAPCEQETFSCIVWMSFWQVLDCPFCTDTNGDTELSSPWCKFKHIWRTNYCPSVCSPPQIHRHTPQNGNSQYSQLLMTLQGLETSLYVPWFLWLVFQYLAFFFANFHKILNIFFNRVVKSWSSTFQENLRSPATTMDHCVDKYINHHSFWWGCLCTLVLSP